MLQSWHRWELCAACSDHLESPEKNPDSLCSQLDYRVTRATRASRAVSRIPPTSQRNCLLIFRYDFARGRNLNVIQTQSAEEDGPLFDNERANGTGYYYLPARGKTKYCNVGTYQY